MHRYQNNAFRVLGLLPDAPMADIVRRANEIKIKRSLGVSIEYECDFSWMGPLDRSEENIINALQRLEDPVLRFKEELSWFWVYTDIDKKAYAYLEQNQRKSAHDIWSERTSDYGPPGIGRGSAFFNQAILSHSSVIGKESLIKYDSGPQAMGKTAVGKEKEPTCPRCHKAYDSSWKICLDCGVYLVMGLKEEVAKSKKRNVALDEAHWKNWNFTSNRFLYLISQEYFWESINEKVKRINDPRLTDDKAKEICKQFFASIIEPNFIFISQALTAKDYERVKKHSSLINGLNLNVGPLFEHASFSSATLSQGFNRVLSNHINSMNSACTNLTKELAALGKEAREEAILKLCKEFAKKADILIYEARMVDINGITDFTIARDNAAKALRNASVDVHNRFSDYTASYEIILKAIDYAGSAYQKQQCEKDARIVKSHLDAAGSAYPSSGTTSSSNTASSQTGSDFWAMLKKVPGLVWVIGFIILVSWISDSGKTTTKTTRRTSPYSSSASSRTYVPPTDETMRIADLKTKIEKLRSVTESQESRIRQLWSEAESKEKDLASLKYELESIDNRYRNATYVPDWVRNNYNSKLQQYNGLVAVYNGFVDQAKRMKISYDANIQEGNRLIAIYNRRIR